MSKLHSLVDFNMCCYYGKDKYARFEGYHICVAVPKEDAIIEDIVDQLSGDSEVLAIKAATKLKKAANNKKIFLAWGDSTIKALQDIEEQIKKTLPENDQEEKVDEHSTGLEVSQEIGLKYDESKLRWDLLPLPEVEQIVRVLQYGAAKYKKDNWQHVSNSRERYYSAALRHLAAWKKGELLDPETSMHHLAHAACNLIFLMWRDNQDELEKSTEGEGLYS